MISCLAIGSVTYYALELVHSVLERELIVELLTAQVEGLEAQVEQLKQGRSGNSAGAGGDSTPTGAGGSWWKLW